MKVILYKED